MTAIYYSTNAWITWHIKTNFFGDRHFVWCSDFFDRNQFGPHHPAALVPPSSSPRHMYQRLKEDVDGSDTHSADILKVRTNFQKVLTDKLADGDLTNDEYTECLALMEQNDLKIFRPVLYVIPKNGLSSAVERVPMPHRAGSGVEHLIRDLKGSEFHMIEY
jgi:hypothetical protein